MINGTAIADIERLLADGTPASLTYAALECRLAIERICYERLRIAHDYISHDDLLKWQPREIVNVLIQEVNPEAASTFTFSISNAPCPEGSPEPTPEEYAAMEFIPVGTHVGFDPKKLGQLWNGLANLALHLSLPVSSDDAVGRYGDAEKIRAKVVEALEEIKRVDAGTLISTGMGEEVSFDCVCGTKNKRRLDLLKNGQTVNCINPKCDESYEFVESDTSFGRRMVEIKCQRCDTLDSVPKKVVERLRRDQHRYFDCGGCGEKITVGWRLMQSQAPNPAPS